MRPCADRERGVMGGHHQRHVRHVLPQESGCEMDGVESAQLRRHWLGSAVEHDTVHLDQFERAGQRQNRAPASREICVVELCPESKTIERSQAFSDDERACDTSTNP